MNTLLQPDKYRDKNVIITGGLGFIGLNLAHRLGDYYGNYRNIHSTLGWGPRTPFQDGIIHSIEYYKKYCKHYRDD